MRKEDYGIVLKSFFPYKQKISILFRNTGKVLLVVPSVKDAQRLLSGMKISCNKSRFGDGFSGNGFSILQVPLFNHGNLGWIHLLLEICYYFVQIEDISFDIFDLLEFCLNLVSKSNLFGKFFYVVQKLCVLKLLFLLSFYPPRNLVFCDNVFQCIVSISVDSKNCGQVSSTDKLFVSFDDEMLKQIDKWILQCIAKHPQCAMFKTCNFLKTGCQTI